MQTDETELSEFAPEVDDQPEQTPSPDTKPDAMAAALSELAASVKEIKSQPTESKAQPTQAEINEFWGVFDPEQTDKEFFRKFFRMNPDATEEELQQAKEVFAMTQKGLVRQALVGAKNLMAQMREELQKEFGPLREYVTQRQMSERREKFHSTYPELADEKFNPILLAVSDSLKDQSFENEDAYFKALAEGAAKHIAGIVPGFTLGAGKTKPKTAATTPRLPRTSAGGTGGAESGRAEAMQTRDGDLSGMLHWT